MGGKISVRGILNVKDIKSLDYESDIDLFGFGGFGGGCFKVKNKKKKCFLYNY